MEIRHTAIEAVIEIRPERLHDSRGWFSEVFRVEVLADAGIQDRFQGDNESFSAAAHTVRGIHFQIDPAPQAKLVRVLSGSILDVAVDLRRSSSTFGEHVVVTLSADEGNQLYVPVGFGHAFCTLTDRCHVAYKISGNYSPARERTIRWNDPALAIQWPVIDDSNLVISDKDRTAPPLAEVQDLFA